MPRFSIFIFDQFFRFLSLIGFRVTVSAVSALLDSLVMPELVSFINKAFVARSKSCVCRSFRENLELGSLETSGDAADLQILFG